MPNWRNSTVTAMILTDLQYLNCQSPSLLEREVIDDRRIDRGNLDCAITVNLVDGVGRFIRFFWLTILHEVLDLAVVGKPTEVVECRTATRNVGGRPALAISETFEGTYGSW